MMSPSATQGGHKKWYYWL